MPRVSVIVPVYNYGSYLRQAIQSVLSQKFDDYEIIIVNDGSTDNTAVILEEFKSRPSIKLITHQENKGLVQSCHDAIENSMGEYIIRLDPDDYFDENALSVLANVLDSDSEVGLVYPDYFLVSESGVILDYVRLPRVSEEVKLLDMPANGAGTMFRRSCYNAVGGYDLSLRCQDGYDLWLKFIRRFKVYNVNLPLFYYRRHRSNLTQDVDYLLTTRRYIKERFTDEEGIARPVSVGIIPVRVHDFCDYLALRDLNGEPLIAYTIKEALRARHLRRVVVATEDERIAAVARSYGAEVVIRSPELTRGPIEHTVLHILDKLKEESFSPETVAVIHVNSPFKKAEHIDEAINTLAIFGVDSVISSCEDGKYHYQHGANGLIPLFEKRLLRLEKEVLYEENGALFVSMTRVITRENLLGKRIGHITMTEQESIHIDTEFDFWLAQQIMKEGRNWVDLES
ncbi:glycosyltransferase [Chloroflexota bacterium]